MSRPVLWLSLSASLLACEGAPHSDGKSGDGQRGDKQSSDRKAASGETSSASRVASARPSAQERPSIEAAAPSSASLASPSASASATTKRLSLEGATVDVPVGLEPLPKQMIDSIIASAVRPEDKDSKFEIAGVGAKPGSGGPLVLVIRTLEPRPSPAATTVRAVISKSIELSKARLGDDLKPLRDEFGWKDDAGEWCTMRSDGTRSVRACSLCWVPDAAHVQCVGMTCVGPAGETACEPIVASRVLTPTSRLPLDKALPALPSGH